MGCTRVASKRWKPYCRGWLTCYDGSGIWRSGRLQVCAAFTEEKTVTAKLDRIIQGDCVKQLDKLDPGSVDLVFADPPFNIGYEYDEYDDRKSADDYIDWSKRWIEGVIRVLKPTGTFWLAIGDEYAAELKVAATRELGLTCRGWIIWYYTFGVHCQTKFSRSHAHLFYFARDPKAFTFNDSAIRVPSARQLVYGDKRANPKGRVPDDTWIIRPTPEKSWLLRPQDLPQGFTADGDTWYFPRVCGTFKERAGFHGCQMPEQLLARIINACSNEGDLVLDPFAGSGTTPAVAKKLNRRYLGIEMSKQYASKCRQRLRRIEPGDLIDGVEDPLSSVPNTANGTIRTEDGKRVKRNGTPKRRATSRKVESGQANLWD
ncbi:MAG: site-specific DNA-methyltransferase [Phycisphaerales bacterium]|nr:MAG: site-specific DNA-methyltransferase [Phycisphaerales bacterium]